MTQGSRVVWVPSREHLARLVLQGEDLGGWDREAQGVGGWLGKGSLYAIPVEGRRWSACLLVEQLTLGLRHVPDLFFVLHLRLSRRLIHAAMLCGRYRCHPYKTEAQRR